MATKSVALTNDAGRAGGQTSSPYLIVGHVRREALLFELGLEVLTHVGVLERVADRTPALGDVLVLRRA